VVVAAIVLVVLGGGIGFALKNPAIRERFNLSTGATTTNDTPTEKEKEAAPAKPLARPEIAQRPGVEVTESPLDKASTTEIWRWPETHTQRFWIANYRKTFKQAS
jgi:hypothetical protein